MITSSDDENDSHFLLPGFFKTIASNKNNEKNNKNKPSSPVQEKEQSETNDKNSQKPSTPSPPPPTSTPPSQPQQSNASSAPPPQEQQKPKELLSSPPTQQQNVPTPPSLQEKKLDNPPKLQKQPNSNSQNGVIKPRTIPPSANQQQNVSPPQIKSKNALIQQEDENIRYLLRYYHMDDGDIVEVAGGSIERIVLVHPERPLPLYIQQNKELLKRIQAGLFYIFHFENKIFFFSIRFFKYFICSTEWIE